LQRVDVVEQTAEADAEGRERVFHTRRALGPARLGQDAVAHQLGQALV
jgi:hypothetical protein